MDRSVEADADDPLRGHSPACGGDDADDGAGAEAGAGAGVGVGVGVGVDIEEAGYQPLWVRLACICLDFLTQTYDQVRIVPEIVLFERWLCQSHFPEHDGQNYDLCRTPEIQYELAQLRSWKAFFDGAAILLTAVPMGLLADRIGRKRVIFTSILGPLLSLCWIVAICMGGYGQGDVRLIWASSIFLLMGNLSSANATIYAMAADSCPPSQRSRYFYYLYSTFLVCELFAPALASLTIERFLIVPFGVGFVCLAFCFPILGIIPETHATAAGHAGPTHGRQRRRPSKDQDETGPLLLPPPPAGPEAPPAPPAPPGPGLGLLAVLRDRNILLALFVLFAGALRQGTVSVLLQYAAVRFGWPASRTAVLVSAIAASNIVLFLAVLPQAVALLTSRWRVPPQVIDYHVVSASLAVLAVGAVCMGLASSVAGLVLSVLFFATGYGTRVAVLSLITAWTDEDTRASTFGLAQIVEGIGRMAGDPILLRIFARSMDMDGVVMGLPFFVAAFGFGTAAIAWRFVNLRLSTRPE